MEDYIYDETFEGIDFSEKGLLTEEYEHCIFARCIFSNADLSGIKFVECTFENCNFSAAKMDTTLFRDVRFIACKLLGVPFEHCEKLLSSMHFDSCNMKLATFYKFNLKKTLFEDCNLRETDFTETDLTASKFNRCDLGGAVFNRTILEHSDFRTSYNFSIDPEINQIKKAKFSLTEVSGLLDKYDIEIE